MTGRLAKGIARFFLWATGWRDEGGRPAVDRFVLIAAPHTSNWDLPYLLAFAAMYGIKVSWMGKHSIFRFPMGGIMRALGGIAVKRDQRNHLVDAMAEEFQQREKLALVVPAEGTRGYTPHWKSGFYRIAQRADVPIVMSFLDYQRKRGGFGPAIQPSGDLRRDMDEIREFYADKVGKYPELFGAVRLKEEM